MTTYEFSGWQMVKEDVEREIGRTMTDDEFNELGDELDGRMENFYNSLYDDLISQAKEAK